MRWAALLPLLVAACSPSAGADGGASSGGTSGGSSGGRQVCVPTGGGGRQGWPALADGGVAVQDYPQAYFAAYCQAMSSCYPLADYLQAECTLALAAFDDFAFQECTAGLCGGYLVQPAEEVQGEARAVAAGRLSYDPEQAIACLASPWPLACDEGELAPTPPPACQTVFSGAVGDGGSCYLDVECVGGACDRSAGCPGYCQPRSPPMPAPGTAGHLCPCAAGLSCAQGLCWGGGDAGAPCASPFDCQPGFYCSPAHGRTCQPQVGDCGACTENLIESQNAWSGQCLPGLLCEGLGEVDGGLVPGFCTPPLPEGGACTPGITPGQFAGPVTGCLPGLDCLNGQCALPPSNGPCLADDAPCLVGTAACFIPTNQCQPVSDSSCAMASCAPGLSCASGTCVASISPPSCDEP